MNARLVKQESIKDGIWFHSERAKQKNTLQNEKSGPKSLDRCECEIRFSIHILW